MARIFILLISSIFIAACAAGLSIERLQDFNPRSKVLVLTEHTRWDPKIRKELSKKGFKVLKYASINKVISEGGKGEIAKIHNEAEARYGLTFYWEQVDSCIYNTSKLINGTFEISDLRTNEVLLVIEKGGWTGPCADPRGMVFVDLAQALSEVWGK